MIKVGVTRENVLSTYNEQVQKLYGAMTISTAAMSEQFHLELEWACFLHLHSQVLFCFTPSCSLVGRQTFSLHHQPSRKEYGFPHKDLPLSCPSQVSKRLQWALQEKVRDSETYEHLPDVI